MTDQDGVQPELTRILFSASQEYFMPASRGLRELAPEGKVERLGPDLGCLSTTASLAEIAQAARDKPVVFVRHLTEELRRLPAAAAGLDVVAAAARELLADRLAPGAEIAVQAWASGQRPVAYGSQELYAALAEELTGLGHQVCRSGAPLVLSAVISDADVSLGLAAPEHALSDWAGGRVRLAKPKGQISRAEFKLEELFKLVDLPLPQGGAAVDLGASPGGWTRILRERGLEVWAVDPGDLDPSLLADPLVHHERTTAGRFFERTRTRFALAVNDMRMDAVLSAEVMLDAAEHLLPGALCVVTFKVGTYKPYDTVRVVLDRLRRRYEIVEARQLQHNRHEITVVGRKRG
ncbi:cell division protein FtsJ [Crossiella sp. SN42]|uniref:SAM-dependent methyltransferase n=1 Tax=Crossiella sp. SN42 TaxID=2944808 RepID=UPI00207D0FE4|nr:SAM-dependent methyltransferase [Crossiella sp. SN42]MCO1577280.1 cell division protein FtsJ [Crossiella sp. SN42]